MSSAKEMLKRYGNYLRPTDLVELHLFTSVKDLYNKRTLNPDNVPKAVPNMRQITFLKEDVEKFINRIIADTTKSNAPQQTNITAVTEPTKAQPAYDDAELLPSLKRIRISSYITLEDYEYVEQEINKLHVNNPKCTVSDWIRDLINKNRRIK